MKEKRERLRSAHLAPDYIPLSTASVLDARPDGGDAGAAPADADSDEDAEAEERVRMAFLGKAPATGTGGGGGGGSGGGGGGRGRGSVLAGVADDEQVWQKCAERVSQAPGAACRAGRPASCVLGPGRSRQLRAPAAVWCRAASLAHGLHVSGCGGCGVQAAEGEDDADDTWVREQLRKGAGRSAAGPAGAAAAAAAAPRRSTAAGVGFGGRGAAPAAAAAAAAADVVKALRNGVERLQVREGWRGLVGLCRVWCTSGASRCLDVRTTGPAEGKGCWQPQWWLGCVQGQQSATL